MCVFYIEGSSANGDIKRTVIFKALWRVNIKFFTRSRLRMTHTAQDGLFKVYFHIDLLF